MNAPAKCPKCDAPLNPHQGLGRVHLQLCAGYPMDRRDYDEWAALLSRQDTETTL